MNITFLQDYLGNKSNGRLLSCICVAIAWICHLMGYKWPNMAEHAQSGVVAFLTAAGVFYGSAKLPEAIATASNKQGDKDAGTA